MLEANRQCVIEFAISLVCRTDWLMPFAERFYHEHPKAFPYLSREDDTHLNRFRMMARHKVWKTEFAARPSQMGVIFNESDVPFVVTDSPVRMTHHEQTGQVGLGLPIDSNAMFIIGHPETVTAFTRLSIQSHNAHLASWAGNQVFCSKPEPLREIARLFTTVDDPGLCPEWQRQARLPFLGTRERITSGEGPPEPRTDQA